MTDIKICGLSEPGTLGAALGAGASHVGFVFFPASPRHVTVEGARGLARMAEGRARRIGLFVDPRDEDVDAAAGFLDGVQLHGKESPARVAQLKARTGLSVWKALGVATRADARGAKLYADTADLILFDAKPPVGAAVPGGRGVRFDWRLLDSRPPLRAWGLSGGLSAENVAEAIAVTGAPLVDVSSGVEDRPGRKSAAMIEAFLKAVKER